MKQKYLILKEKDNKLIKIQEFAELDKEALSLLCEEAYDFSTIKSAISSGKDALILALRTKNMYPPGIYAEKIAMAVAELYKSKDKDSLELLFDDIELLTKDRKAVEVREPGEDDSTDIDELLEDDSIDEMIEDDMDDSYEDKDGIKKMGSSLKIADDDFADVDDDT